jgi:capsid portal protein
VFTTVNTSVHQPRQGKLQTDLKTLFLNLVDMHRASPNLEEDMEFAKGIIVKNVLAILLSLGNLIIFSCASTF